MRYSSCPDTSRCGCASNSLMIRYGALVGLALSLADLALQAIHRSS
jgi:hypothetical protein